MGAEYLKECHPEFRGLAKKLLTHVSHLCSLTGCAWYLASVYRSPEKQWELYQKGRRKIGVDWAKIPGEKVVTYAKPEDTPHCVAEGSCAIDVALTENGKWLPDNDPRWSIIGTAVALTNREALTWGGTWSRLRDCPHVELTDWRTI